MDPSLRNTPGLIVRIEKLQGDLIKRFENLVGLAAIEHSDRNSTAVTQYQIQVETAALIRAGEDVQVLIRQLQETWLFGQLNTIGESKAQQESDESAKVVATMLEQLAKRQQGASVNGTTANGDAVMGNGS